MVVVKHFKSSHI